MSHLENYLVGQKILDAGCGGGAFVDLLSRKGYDVTGVDLYEDFLQVAKAKGFQGNFVQGDLSCLPFTDKKFDCTYCFDVLEHVDDKLVIQELARVTSKRLILVVPKEDITFNRYSLTLIHYIDKTHQRYYTEESLKQLLSTINPSKVAIFPELPVPLQYMFQEMIESDVAGNSKFLELKLSVFLRVMKNAIKALMKLQKPDLASLRKQAAHNFFITALEQVSYKKIHTGLVAVVDLA